MRRYGWLVAGLLLLGWWAWSQRAPVTVAGAPRDTPQVIDTHAPLASSPDVEARAPTPSTARSAPSWLPREAFDTLQLIARDGPYPHRQDGGVFQNRERLLPQQPRGYYHEYTVRTPGARDRGARRIVTGGDPPREFFYSDDHYRSFRRFTPAQVRK